MDFHQLQGDKIGFAREIYGAAVGANGAPRLQIGAEAVGQRATFVEDPRSYTLYFDPDGAGSIPKIPIAYLPYWILKPADLIWLDQPIDGQSVGQINSTWAPQASGDFSGDGNTDVIWQDSAGRLSVWLMRDAKLAATFALPKLSGWELLATGDFNGDKATDLLWQNQAGALGEWFMRDGKRAATAQLPALKGWELLASGDFNGDKTTDLIWQNADGKLGEWVMHQGKRQATVTLPTMQGVELVARGDFNGDGTDDLLWQGKNGAIREWLMANGRRGTELDLPATMPGWTVVGVGDFNGDGTDDLLWQHAADGALVAWRMENGQRVGTDYIGQGAGSELLAVGDVNGDGTADLMWRQLVDGGHQGLAAVSAGRERAARAFRRGAHGPGTAAAAVRSGWPFCLCGLLAPPGFRGYLGASAPLLPSSSGLGRGPLKAETGVRFP